MPVVAVDAPEFVAEEEEVIASSNNLSRSGFGLQAPGFPPFLKGAPRAPYSSPHPFVWVFWG